VNLYFDDEPEKPDGELDEFDEAPDKLDVLLVNFVLVVISTTLIFFTLASFYKGVNNAYVYSQSYDRMLPISGKDVDGGSKRSNFFIRVKISPENFPAISNEALFQAQQKSREKKLLVSSQYYASVKRGDDIHIEYAERGGKLYIRRADNHIPSWLYLIFSFFGFLGLRKIYRVYFPC